VDNFGEVGKNDEWAESYILKLHVCLSVCSGSFRALPGFFIFYFFLGFFLCQLNFPDFFLKKKRKNYKKGIQTNETRKGKNSKIILKEKKLQK